MIDVSVCYGARAPRGFQSFISIQGYVRQDFNTDLEFQRLLTEILEAILAIKVHLRFAESR